MSHWNYRIMRYSEEQGGGLGIHEVYYNDDGDIWAYTTNSIIGGDDIEELKRVLKTIENDIERSKGDILEYGNCSLSELGKEEKDPVEVLLNDAETSGIPLEEVLLTIEELESKVEDGESITMDDRLRLAKDRINKMTPEEIRARMKEHGLIDDEQN